eukprot:4615625-Amphidinium_carterae.1
MSTVIPARPFIVGGVPIAILLRGSWQRGSGVRSNLVASASLSAAPLPICQAQHPFTSCLVGATTLGGVLVRRHNDPGVVCPTRVIGQGLGQESIRTKG